jgi:hypothetical protein
LNRDKIYDFIRRHPQFTGLTLLVLGAVLMALFVPRSLQKISSFGLLLGFTLFVFWAKTSSEKKQQRPAGGIVTIADYFKRSRLLLTRAVGIPCIVWCVIVSFDDQLSRGHQQIAAVSGGLVIACLGWLLFRDRFRCPQCGTNFRKERLEKLGRWTMDKRGTEELWDSCPNCHVGFQTPMPGTGLS